MNTASQVLDVINELESRFPVQTWRCGDIHLWPVYRIRLFMDVTLAILNAQPPATRARRAGQLAKRAARTVWRVGLAAWRDRPMNARLRSDIVALFLSDGLSFTRVDGKWCDRVVDPLQEAIESRGLPTLKLTPLAEAHIPRLLPSRFVQPVIDVLKITARGGAPHAELADFDAFHEIARVRFDDHAHSRDWLLLQAARLDRLARWFLRILRATGTRLALVNNYYSLEGMAFVQAARRFGVTSVDLQHGLQGRQHGAYGRWKNVPEPAGYSTLPDEFWVWSKDEANAIDEWRAFRPFHRPRVTGNLWRDRWFDENDSLVSRYLRQARELRGDASVPQVLVSLAWGLGEEETDKLIEAAKLCGRRFAWWWRLHPVEAHRCGEFTAKLQGHGLDGSQVGPATSLPLYALLRNADVIVSHSSTVMQEGAVFGVPSVITSEYGAELHADLLINDSALLATTPQAIADSIIQLKSRRDQAAVSPANGIDRLLDEVFGTRVSASVPRGQSQ